MKLVNIISYFGKDDTIIAKRKDYHNRQIDWFLERGFKCHILAQEYQPEDFRSDSNISYTKIDKVVTPGDARNILLKDYYSSDEDFCVMADNDSILYDHGAGANNCWIEVFRNRVDEFVDIDLAVPVNPGWEPFTKKLQEELHVKNLVFKKNWVCKGSLFILKNLKKHYGIEIYYDQRFNANKQDGKILSGEDGDFPLQMIAQGLGTYKFESVVLKEFAGQASTWANTTEYRSAIAAEMHNYWYEKYKSFGMEIKNDRVNARRFLNKNFKKPKLVVIPKIREENTWFS